MELEELSNIWKSQKISSEREYSKQALLMILNNKTISFEEQIKSRDRFEIIAAIVVIISFGVILFITPSVWQKTGCGIIILSAFWVWYKFKSVQHIAIEDEPDCNHNMYNHLQQELHWVKKQKTLLENVLWWYVLPFMTGLVIFALGFSNRMVKIFYIIGIIILGSVIWILNHRAIIKRFNPFIEELEDAISVIEEPNK